MQELDSMVNRFAFLSGSLAFVCLMAGLAFASAQSATSDLIEIDAHQPELAPGASDFRGGTSLSPSGHVIGVNDRYLTLDGKHWLPVMGEFHFSRYPEADWEEEILKMKAGGVQIIASYIFWNHVEEVEGNFNWTEQRDLRHFTELCNKHGMYFFPRMGPWAHGESRYGGLPDWVVQKSAPRTSDPRFLGYVNTLYQQIGKQLQGLLWKDGGPVIGVQIENEYSGKGPNGGPGYMLSLKKMAIAAGLDVPLYTVTGWNNASWPPGEFLPVYGGYADAPWDPSPGPLPPSEVYLFRFQSRTSGDMGAIGVGKVSATQTDPQSPFLTAEVGAGLQSTYHRRPVVSAEDVAAMVPVIVGSGANLLGYYMYQGGENPDGDLGPLNESKSTGYPTDVPVKNYDFEAPLSEFGNERQSYRDLKLFNYFLNNFGQTLAPMTVHPPIRLPSAPADTVPVRVAARTAGDSGFLFLNNHVRGLAMPSRNRVQVSLQLPSGPMLIPTRPIDVPADSYFIWPINIDLDGVRLRYSTAQPLCRMERGRTVLYVFFAIPGIPAELSFSTQTGSSIQASAGTKTMSQSETLVSGIEPSTNAAIESQLPGGKALQIVVLTRKQAESTTRVTLADGEHLVLSPQEVFSDGRLVTLRALEQPDFRFSAWPPLTSLQGASLRVQVLKHDGIFKSYRAEGIPQKVIATWNPERSNVPTSVPHSDATTVPTEAEFQAAPKWSIRLPRDAFVGVDDLFLNVDYQGDIARLNAADRLLTDDFYKGMPWSIGLKRFRQQVEANNLNITVLPWRDRSKVVLDSFGTKKNQGDGARILGVTVLPEYQLTIP
jgi:beta-galactosidase